MRGKSESTIAMRTVATHRQSLAAISCVAVGLSARSTAMRSAAVRGGAGGLIGEHPLAVGVAVAVSALRQEGCRQESRGERRCQHEASFGQAAAQSVPSASRRAAAQVPQAEVIARLACSRNVSASESE